MANIKCLIVDDEAIAQRIIAGYISDIPNLEVVAVCSNAMEAMELLNREPVDIMFLDIEMPKLKGLAFLKTLKSPPAVIITTAHREYALEGYELEVVDYLLKPISFERFIKAVNKYSKYQAPGNIESASAPWNESLYVKSDRKTIKLQMSEITYIEGMNNYIIIHVADKRHAVYTSLTELLEQLNDNFLRIHKSYVINKAKIQSFTKEQVDLAEKTLPIGKMYKQVTQEF